jgi:hypothetical protein
MYKPNKFEVTFTILFNKSYTPCFATCFCIVIADAKVVVPIEFVDIAK